MPLLNRAVELAEEVAEWRRELHTMPEILYDVHQTAAFVAAKLKLTRFRGHLNLTDQGAHDAQVTPTVPG